MTVLIDEAASPVPIDILTSATFGLWCETLAESERRWVESIAFTPKPGKTLLLPGADGALARVVQVADPAQPVWALAGLPYELPPGDYRLTTGPEVDPTPSALGWALGAYRFTRYRAADRAPARLVWPAEADRGLVAALSEGIVLARDLINTPCEAMGPPELAEAAINLARQHGADISLIIGDALVEQNYPLIHAVGRASVQAPRLIDLRWGDPESPRVTLIGKGVCFDSGGLDLKTATGMKMMKKDMGGAATVLGLAHAIMATGLKLRLRVLIPAVENAVAGNAFRPLDIFRSRRGTTVEIGNTDAEGRLILADALAEAVSEAPALLIDMATLTGAARVALGPDLPAMFSNDDDLAASLAEAAGSEADPLWRLPLWAPYRALLDSKVADINNSSDSGFAGAITAALFLQGFVDPCPHWIHIDTYAWNPTTRPGRPEGGDALGLRAIYRMLRDRFG